MWHLVRTLISLVLANRYQQLVRRCSSARGRRERFQHPGRNELERSVSSPQSQSTNAPGNDPGTFETHSFRQPREAANGDDPCLHRPAFARSSSSADPPSYSTTPPCTVSANSLSSFQSRSSPTPPPSYSLVPSPPPPYFSLSTPLCSLPIRTPPVSTSAHTPNVIQRLGSNQHHSGQVITIDIEPCACTICRGTAGANSAEYVHFTDDENLGPQFGVIVDYGSHERHRSLYPEVVDSDEERSNAVPNTIADIVLENRINEREQDGSINNSWEDEEQFADEGTDGTGDTGGYDADNRVAQHRAGVEGTMGPERREGEGQEGSASQALPPWRRRRQGRCRCGCCRLGGEGC